MKSAVFVTILLTTIICSACRKHYLRKYAGDYECEVLYKNFNMIDGHSESVSNAQVQVKRNGNFIEVNNWKVHVDSVRKERVYKEGYYPTSKSIQFVKDSMYLYYWSGGQGGNSSSNYSCKKN